jgi:two-component system sensor histidine kinase KdpD
VLDNNQEAGLGTNTLPAAGALYLPLEGAHGTIGVMSVRPRSGSLAQDPDERQLLDTFARQTALAIERANLADDAARAEVQVQTERMRTSLLTSVSHDFRAPLLSIAESAKRLKADSAKLSENKLREETQAIIEDAERLHRLVQNMLDVTRLESGDVALQKSSQALATLADNAIQQLARRLVGRSVSNEIPRDLPAVAVDGALIEQLFVHLLENAAAHTPAGSPVEIRGRVEAADVVLEVADRGPGLASDQLQSVFEKFRRYPKSGQVGVGLGLTISQAIVVAHGGRIMAENRAEGGAIFRIRLPLNGVLRQSTTASLSPTLDHH